MNCYDCAQADLATTAVAVCHDCGAGLCPEHAVRGQQTLTVARPVYYQAPVDPPQRRIRCQICAAAIEAANRLSATQRPLIRSVG